MPREVVVRSSRFRLSRKERQGQVEASMSPSHPSESPGPAGSGGLGADGARILAAADRNGGRAEWGLRELIPGRLHAEPAVLLERLLPAIIKLLNKLMAATPVEDLSGVSLTPEKHAPPQDRNSPFGERERLSIRWQLGF